jgi:hypothetical protein
MIENTTLLDLANYLADMAEVAVALISDEELADMESRELAYRAEVEEAEAEHLYAMGGRL